MNYCINCHDFFLNDQRNELDSDIYAKICGYHFYILVILTQGKCIALNEAPGEFPYF